MSWMEQQLGDGRRRRSGGTGALHDGGGCQPAPPRNKVLGDPGGLMVAGNRVPSTCSSDTAGSLTNAISLLLAVGARGEVGAETWGVARYRAHCKSDGP